MRVGSYLDNVHAQPETLQTACEAYAEPAFDAALEEAAVALGGRAVTSTGMGASLFAVHARRSVLDAALSQHWIDETSYLEENLALLGRPLEAVLMLSQSGETVEARKLLTQLPSVPRVLITRDAGSSLAGAADVVLPQHCPRDLSVSIQTYTTQIAVLALLAARIVGRDTETVLADLRRCADAMGKILTGMDAQIEAAAKTLAGTQQIYALGRGDSIASALGTALLFKEGAKRGCEAQSTAQFRHGAVEVVDEEVGILLFASEVAERRQLDLNAIQEFVSYGGQVVVVCAHDFPDCDGVTTVRLPETPAALRSIVEIVPSQLITDHLAQANGVVAGDFRNTVPVIVSA